MVSVSSRSDSYFVEEVESLLLAQEARIEKHSKELDSSLSGQANVANNKKQRGSSHNGGYNFSGQNQFQSYHYGSAARGYNPMTRGGRTSNGGRGGSNVFVHLNLLAQGFVWKDCN